jgi:chromosome segregation ATPase
MSIINIFSDLSTKFSLKSLEEGIRFFESLPTPEESLVEAKRQEIELETTIQKIKEKIIEIENKIFDLKNIIHENSEDSEKQDFSKEELEDKNLLIEELNDSLDYLKTQLENYEAEYEYVKEQAVMFNSIANEDDDDFIDNIPTFYDAMKNSVDKKIKDVKEAISIIKKK